MFTVTRGLVVLGFAVFLLALWRVGLIGTNQETGRKRKKDVPFFQSITIPFVVLILMITGMVIVAAAQKPLKEIAPIVPVKNTSK
jgi:hypothetical protein